MPNARAVIIREPGDESVLDIGEIEVRPPGPHEVAVEVVAAGLNRADLLQRQGFYPAPAGVHPQVPGLEFAGRIEQVGAEVRGFHVGDEVMGIVAGAGMATTVIAAERELLPVPSGLSLIEAAAIPEVFMTAYDALMVQGRAKLNDVVLIHAVGSGVGTAALQLASLCGARAVGTSRSENKLARCRALGLQHEIVVSREKPAFAEACLDRVGRGADVILDFVGAAYLKENVRALATGGHLIVIGLMGGAKAELGLGPLLAKRAHISGTVLRSRPSEEKARLAQDFIREVLPAFGKEGPLRPVIEDTVPMNEIRQAHQLMASNQTFGKVVLTW